MKRISRIYSGALIFIIIVLSLNANAHEIKIKSFSLQMEPMTVPMQRTDANGNVCALVKVIMPAARASFEGSLIGNCDYKTSEYWCYLSPGSKHLKIKYPGCEPLMVNFEKISGDGLKPKQIYELCLIIPSISVELNQKIHTITLNVHSSDKNTLLGKSSFEQLDNLVVERFNRNGTLLDSFTYSKGVLASINGLYEFTLGAVVGDKFNVKADGYVDKMIPFTDGSRKSYDIELSPEKYNLKFQVIDSITKEPLIGVAVKHYSGDILNFKSLILDYPLVDKEVVSGDLWNLTLDDAREIYGDVKEVWIGNYCYLNFMDEHGRDFQWAEIGRKVCIRLVKLGFKDGFLKSIELMPSAWGEDKRLNKLLKKNLESCGFYKIDWKSYKDLMHLDEFSQEYNPTNYYIHTEKRMICTQSKKENVTTFQLEHYK